MRRILVFVLFASLLTVVWIGAAEEQIAAESLLVGLAGGMTDIGGY